MAWMCRWTENYSCVWAALQHGLILFQFSNTVFDLYDLFVIDVVCNLWRGIIVQFELASHQ